MGRRSGGGTRGEEGRKWGMHEHEAGEGDSPELPMAAGRS